MRSDFLNPKKAGWAIGADRSLLGAWKSPGHIAFKILLIECLIYQIYQSQSNKFGVYAFLFRYEIDARKFSQGFAAIRLRGGNMRGGLPASMAAPGSGRRVFGVRNGFKYFSGGGAFERLNLFEQSGQALLSVRRNLRVEARSASPPPRVRIAAGAHGCALRRLAGRVWIRIFERRLFASRGGPPQTKKPHGGVRLFLTAAYRLRGILGGDRWT